MPPLGFGLLETIVFQFSIFPDVLQTAQLINYPENSKLINKENSN